MKHKRGTKRFGEELDVWRVGRREGSDDSEILRFGEWVGGDVIITRARTSSRRSRLVRVNSFENGKGSVFRTPTYVKKVVRER